VFQVFGAIASVAHDLSHGCVCAVFWFCGVSFCGILIFGFAGVVALTVREAVEWVGRSYPMWLEEPVVVVKMLQALKGRNTQRVENSRRYLGMHLQTLSKN
jgi:hypothetical protein